MRLSAASVDHLLRQVARPHRQLRPTGNRIVHFGTGAFLRAHLAVYTDDANNRDDAQ